MITLERRTHGFQSKIKRLMKKNISMYCILAVLAACKPGKDLVQIDNIKQTISNVTQTYAPDKRVAIFKVEPVRKNNAVILRGETSLPVAKNELLTQLKAQNIAVQDSIQLLPAATLGDKLYGLVSVSVANIRSEPKHSAELATQAILGTPVKVLNKKGDWYQVQTPDDYIAWVDEGGVHLMNQTSFQRWQDAKKVIYLSLYGFSLTEPRADVQTVSDLVGGDILELLQEQDGYYKVAYPDGRTAFVRKEEAKPYEVWVSSLETTEQSLVATAKKLMGIPYLWGGTSLKGLDCSGFTKNVYFLNGLVLPRDASQQVHTGTPINTSIGFEDLKPGDLLFFGKTATSSSKEKVTHVGMWIGNNEYIHASGSSGKVTINSFNKSAHNFNEDVFNSFLRAKRILNSDQGDILKLQSAKIYQLSDK